MTRKKTEGNITPYKFHLYVLRTIATPVPINTLFNVITRTISKALQCLRHLLFNVSNYELHCHLTGHQDAILCLAVSDTGLLLASRGFDGLRMWDICSQSQLEKPMQIQSIHDPITTVLWVTCKGDLQDTLCCGTGLSHLIVWRQRPNMVIEFDEIVSRHIGNGQEIMAISSDMESVAGVRIAVGTHNKQVQVWALDAGNQLSNIFSIELSTTMPWAVHFLGGDMAVFGMYNGNM
ncbi:hypothetical protein ID866_12546 [Astraeus odoratus]|nr:hypothetical protein ID866_12546 [Astraeus odoratus]